MRKSHKPFHERLLLQLENLLVPREMYQAVRHLTNGFSHLRWLHVCGFHADHDFLEVHYILPEHIMKIKFVPAGLVKQNKNPDEKPSGELEMHAYLQRHYKGCRAVVHLHPTNIIAAMFAGWDLQALSAKFPEVSRYTKVGPTVPVLPVTSTELANATWQAMTEPVSKHTGTKRKVSYDIVGQAAHGVCAVGPNPWDAYEHIERLEHICEIALKSGVRPY